MPRPQPRPVTRHALIPPEPEPAAAPPPGAAAKDADPAGRPAGRRSGKQLGLRIPDDLYARLVACTEDTGIPQSTLVRRALDKELKSRQH